MPGTIQSVRRPSTVGEAIKMLKASRGRACFLAGGTDIALNISPGISMLIDISHLGLSYVRRTERWYRIGAATTIADLWRSTTATELAGGLLQRVAASWASTQISNRATIGGNLAHGNPAADLASPLLALDAQAVLIGTKRRIVPLTKFWIGAGRTVIDNELLVEIAIPSPPKATTWEWDKLTATADAVPIVSITVAIQLGTQTSCTWARIALGSAAPTPMRIYRAERLLVGRRFPDPVLLEAVCAEVAGNVQAIDDFRASSEYRRDIARILVRRAFGRIGLQLEGTQ